MYLLEDSVYIGVQDKGKPYLTQRLEESSNLLTRLIRMSLSPLYAPFFSLSSFLLRIIILLYRVL